MNEPIENGNVSSGLVYYLKRYMFITLIDCELQQNGDSIPVKLYNLHCKTRQYNMHFSIIIIIIYI